MAIRPAADPTGARPDRKRYLYLKGRKFRIRAQNVLPICAGTSCVRVMRKAVRPATARGAVDARTHKLFLAELREFIRDTKPFSLHLRNSYGARRNILKKEEDAKRFRKISLSSGQVILSVEAASSPSAPCPILMDKSSLGARSQWRSGGVGGWVGDGGGGTSQGAWQTTWSRPAQRAGVEVGA